MRQPGRRNTRAHFSRRQVVSVRERGGFVVFTSAWAEHRAATGREQVQAGQEVAFETATLNVVATPATRQISTGHRVTIDAVDHRITSVGRPAGGEIEIAISTDLGES